MAFLLDLLIKDLDLGLDFGSCNVWLDSAIVWSVTVRSVGLFVLLDPFDADTYALERRFKPDSSELDAKLSLDNVKNERNISLIFMSSFAEHSSSFTLEQKETHHHHLPK